MSTETLVEPKLGDAPPCWPPVAHIVRKENRPVKEGTLAVCGAKLMGIDLKGTDVGKVCEKCVEIVKKELGL